MPMDPNQLLENLGRANAVRCARARVKRAIAAGERSPAEVILEPPPCMHTAAVADVLTAGPYMGSEKTAKVMRALQMRPNSRLRDLSERRRHQLVARIREDYPVMWQRWQEPIQTRSAA